jgi:hypothetical protein
MPNYQITTESLIHKTYKINVKNEEELLEVTQESLSNLFLVEEEVLTCEMVTYTKVDDEPYVDMPLVSEEKKQELIDNYQENINQ